MSTRTLLQRFQDSKIGIYGIGSTGRSLVEHLGPIADRLVVFEDNSAALSRESGNYNYPVEWVDSPSILDHDLDFIISSPGIPGDHTILRQARERGVPVWDEIEFAYRVRNDGTFWAITGTNGKSTCADLTGQLLAEKYGENRVSVCGNRGSPLLNHVLEAGDGHHYVVEISSFQVEGLDEFRPDGALLTTLGDDHRDYHRSLYEYHSLKWQLLKSVKTDGPIVLPDDLADREWLSERSDVRRFDRRTVVGSDVKYSDEEGLELTETSLKPDQITETLNLFPENILAVYALLKDELSDDQVESGLKNFRPLDYRAGSVETSNGRRVINDSKGTNPSAVQTLLERLNSPFHLVLGGGGKDTDYTDLVDTLASESSPAKGIVLAGTGSTARRVEELCDDRDLEYRRFERWEEAVKSTYKRACDGETVVLSPGGTSFDAFDNYRDRGEAFDRWIEEASNEKSPA